MEQFTLKSMQKAFGVPLTALIIGAAIFMLPKLIFESIIYYKETAQHFNEKHR